VDWILGEESTTDQTLDSIERSLLRSFLAGDGALFISGSEIGYHLDHLGADRAFYNSMLHASYRGDDAGTYNVSGVSGPFAALSFSFDAPGMYDADYPDQLYPTSGSGEALRYQGGQGGAAAVYYASGCERVVTFGFPFETIQPSQRHAVMSAVLSFLGECLNPVVDTSIEHPSYGSAHNSLPKVEGRASVQHAVLDRVEVLLKNADTSKYWDGTAWVSSETWMNAVGAMSWSYDLPASLPEGGYELRARGRTTENERDDTPAESLFTYDTIPPATANLITPTGSVTVTALPTLVLDWEDVDPGGGSAISYFGELDGETWTTTKSAYTVTRIADGMHTWRVRVGDEAGNASGWSATGTFFVKRHHTRLPFLLLVSGEEEPVCSNVILNGGFESDEAWIVNPEGYPTYSAERAHRGARSGIVGYDEAPWSSVRQEVMLPEGSSATLRLWLYPISQASTPGDWHYVSLWDQDGVRYNLELTTSNAAEWRQGEYDLSDFMGQRVTIIIGANNDGDGHLTRAYVDDVELEVCP
jgi:hypothetical protein